MKRVLLKNTITRSDVPSIIAGYALVIVNKPIPPSIQDQLINAHVLFIENCPLEATVELKDALSLMDDDPTTLSELYTHCLSMIQGVKNSTVID